MLPANPPPLPTLLGLAVCLVVFVLVFVKLVSASSSSPIATKPASASPTRSKQSDPPLARSRPRGSLTPSLETPPVSLGSAPRAPSFARPSPLSGAAIAFRESRARLMEGHRKLMLQMSNASPEERHQALEKWNGEHAAELEEQQQLAIRMGEESRPPLLPVPSAPRIPDNASPELREFLTARHELMAGRAELSNQLRTATPEQRHLAMEEWNEKNASRLDALRATSTRLSSSQPQRHSPPVPEP